MKQEYDYVRILHHGNTVWVRTDLMGRHRDYCLCHKCKKFKPEVRRENCTIANEVYAVDCRFGLVTPVWECPEFEENMS